ncbi:MAG: cytochrome C, partial [Nitrospinota bacterium]|nr:cytochrome C [Nitrospinota bacterium]
MSRSGFLAILFAALFSAATAHGQGLGSLITPGPLAKPHVEVEGLTNCVKCHALGSGVPKEKCFECHKDIASRITSNKGYHASVAKEKCHNCHEDHKGRKYLMIQWPGKDINKFKHKETGYLLDGKHVKVKCEKCHTAKTKQARQSFFLTSNTCLSCHKKDDVHKGVLGDKCETCHTTNGWKGKDLKFDHDKAYKLEFSHIKTSCEKCHPVKGQFKVPGFKKCITCHKKDDVHKGALGDTCDKCHVAKTWKGKDVLLNHDKFYRLDTGHQKTPCEKCHLVKGQYKVPNYKLCVTCHRKDDVHKGTLGNTCDKCHRA